MVLEFRLLAVFPLPAFALTVPSIRMALTHGCPMEPDAQGLGV